MNSIKSIPHRKGDTGESSGNYWEETEKCAGFKVSNDCPWRFQEMTLVSYTPSECLQDPKYSCE
jgi:hypothetical protein